ncbi:hypothetical protein AB0M39_14375 [Streptomyces sp. NPDC051907]|uniref:hypothetical protein n=1 Tax=Streptomyces sp. NPDC051907 TaxID=3155284 RepID=UPI0034304512
MNGDEIERARIRTAVAWHVRRRVWAEAEAVLTTVLGDAGHEDRAPPWGATPEGPVAWIGSAPDDG